MFRLNEAVRRRQAGQSKSVDLEGVAATVTILSPRPLPGATGAVASVAAVATPPTKPANIARMIEDLRQTGASLHIDGWSLVFRPSDWLQLEGVSPHWEAILLFLKTTKYGDRHGAGRSA